MKLSDLKSGQGKVDIEVTVKSVSPPRTFNKFGKDLKVANATVTDGSSDIILSLWNDDADKVKAGDKVKISNGFVSEFNGAKQLTSGKFGKLEVISADNPDLDEDALEDTKAVKKKSKKDDEIEEQEF